MFGRRLKTLNPEKNKVHKDERILYCCIHTRLMRSMSVTEKHLVDSTAQERKPDFDLCNFFHHNLPVRWVY